ncbi:hypothetical protein RWH43_00890 [Microbacterium sp. KSW2-21]|uniref:Uncharacterized protein n=1 Tax=Microbacterium algihabitans TaxID=3075992 RepID=A0ABU3RR73_9MICO|nr:hypothetical protein [Microbacterium sp. KSW2-21]MDU0325300.1 hypothetical protein [Microbacterium sp. KSW2-21]
MTTKKAPGAVAAASEGEDQDPWRGTIMHIIPETDDARQMVREWAAKAVASECSCGTPIVDTVIERGHAEHEYHAPTWPQQLTPWWASKTTVSYQGLGEAGVTFTSGYGETVISAFVTVIVSRRHAHLNPGKDVGEWIEYGLEVNISEPHEGMTLVEAEGVLLSLSRSVARLRQIKTVGA